MVSLCVACSSLEPHHNSPSDSHISSGTSGLVTVVTIETSLFEARHKEMEGASGAVYIDWAIELDRCEMV